MLPALWVFSDVALIPKHERNALRSPETVGASPTIAMRAP